MKVIKHLILVLFLLLVFQQSQAQKPNSNLVDGQVTMLSGEVIECQVILPIGNYINVSERLFLIDSKGNESRLESDDIQYLIISKDEVSFFILRSEYNKYRGKESKSVTSTQKYWLMMRLGCEEISAFSVMGQLSRDKFGSFRHTFREEKQDYCLISKGEKIPTRVCKELFGDPIDGLNAKRRKEALEIYFYNNEEASQRLINSKSKVTHDQLKSYIEARCN